MNVLDFEKWIWEREKVKIFVRADPHTTIRVEDPEIKMFASTNTIRQFKMLRLQPILGTLEYVILTHDLKEARDSMTLMDLRKGYRDNYI